MTVKLTTSKIEAGMKLNLGMESKYYGGAKTNWVTVTKVENEGRDYHVHYTDGDGAAQIERNMTANIKWETMN